MTAPDSVPEHIWRPDHFLDRYEVLTLPLGDDPDGEDPISATLIRRSAGGAAARGAVLYVHGFTDYFFQDELAQFFHDRDYAFYALDLRKCGRSFHRQQTPHYISDLAYYDDELNAALDVIAAETAPAGRNARVLVAGHSTGGLVTSLWLDRLRRTDPQRHARTDGLLLNSPWLDLQGETVLRTGPTARLLSAVAAVRPKALVPRELSSAYGQSLHISANGEWSYDLDRKPLTGFPVTFGWLSAIRQGQLALHRGIDVGVPVLSLRSDKSRFRAEYDVAVDTADCVLDVQHIAKWSPFIARRVMSVAVGDARHDVFLSQSQARAEAYAAVDQWLRAELDVAAVAAR
nr:alpha/beta hydrolase [Gordonia hirsuta]